MKNCTDFAGLLEGFFTDRLMRQRQASPHTIASYRDTFRLLLEFAQQRIKKEPSGLTLADMNAPLLAVQTGLRVSESIGLQCQDVTLDSGAHVRCQGKGRKECCTPPDWNPRRENGGVGTLPFVHRGEETGEIRRVWAGVLRVVYGVCLAHLLRKTPDFIEK